LPPVFLAAFCRHDEKQMIFQASRPILINGIEDLAERGDLLDRIVNLHLPPIPKQAPVRSLSLILSVLH
jgi:hypothetical protein